ncbi:MAG: butyryl-CoA:acetate CoA-transferase [Megasphaera sp.]|jgi:acyl-CoA hydrolase|nr:butyryl-CoA:acetate CoA-transferase [Megasphaera sp.]MCH4188580.1 butyryl-CoA:acetate CoA-transferase [Megasphaera sp.]MCH4218286.1 butyryl-CoA:acetate CoA-transferase [Megasphaera sp.]
MTYQQEYQQKLRTADEAVRLVKDGDWVDYSQSCSFPELLDAALGRRAGALHDVNIRYAISTKPPCVVEADPDRQSFTYNLWHCSGRDRKYIEEGRAFHSPMLFRFCGSYYQRGFAPVNVAMVTVAPMDTHGCFSYGLTNCCQQEIINAADYVILEVNPHMPTVYGMADDHIHISEVDCVVESDVPLSTLPGREPSDIDKKIAAYIFPYLHDGMTLQLGIGGMPNALGKLIAASDLRDLGMHTELMSDGYLDLYRAGKITNRKKKLQRGKGVFSICMGSPDLYAFLDHNQDILSAPMSYVNNPDTIRQLDDFVSINSCISMDLYGQVCSESVGTRQISGTGGQLDFVTGSYMAEHGKGFLAMPSVYTDKKGNHHSNILPRFTAGDIITTPRTQAPYMVTEYGVANLAGLSTWQRAEAIIGIAHPDCREALIKAAEQQHIWRRSNKV